MRVVEKNTFTIYKWSWIVCLGILFGGGAISTLLLVSAIGDRVATVFAIIKLLFGILGAVISIIVPACLAGEMDNELEIPYKPTKRIRIYKDNEGWCELYYYRLGAYRKWPNYNTYKDENEIIDTYKEDSFKKEIKNKRTLVYDKELPN